MEILIWRVDLSDELIGNFPLKVSGPMGEEEDTGLEKLNFVIHGDVFTDLLSHLVEKNILLKAKFVNHFIVDHFMCDFP